MTVTIQSSASPARAAERLLGQRDRVAIVSGASGGIGSVCALQLAELGATVIAGYHSNEEAVRKLAGQADEGRIIPVRADVADPEQVGTLVSTALDRFGRVDTCVAAAGLRTRRLAMSTD